MSGSSNTRAIQASEPNWRLHSQKLVGSQPTLTPSLTQASGRTGVQSGLFEQILSLPTRFEPPRQLETNRNDRASDERADTDRSEPLHETEAADNSRRDEDTTSTEAEPSRAAEAAQAALQPVDIPSTTNEAAIDEATLEPTVTLETVTENDAQAGAEVYGPQRPTNENAEEAVGDADGTVEAEANSASDSTVDGEANESLAHAELTPEIGAKTELSKPNPSESNTSDEEALTIAPTPQTDSAADDAGQDTRNPNAKIVADRLSDEQEAERQRRFEASNEVVAKPESSEERKDRAKWFEQKTDEPNSTSALSGASKANAESELTNTLSSPNSDSPNSTASPSDEAPVGLELEAALPDTASQSALVNSPTVHNMVTGSEAAAKASGVSGDLTSSGLDGDALQTTGNSEPRVGPRRASGLERADAGANAANSAEADPLSQQEKVRMIQRVARSFSRLGPTGGEINLRLHPPQLGSLNVKVRLEGNTLTAKLSTESAGARDAILENLPVLKSRLAEQGIDVAQFQVEVAENQADAAFGESSHRQADEQFGNPSERQSEWLRRRTLASASRSDEETLPERFANSARELQWSAASGIDVQA